MFQQYSSGDRGSILQLAKYSGILKREYEQAKVEKRALKEQVLMIMVLWVLLYFWGVGVGGVLYACVLYFCRLVGPVQSN